MADFLELKKELGKMAPLEKEFGMAAITYSIMHQNGEIENTPQKEVAKLVKRLDKTMEGLKMPFTMRIKYSNLLHNMAQNPVTAIFFDLMCAPESEFFMQWLYDSAEANAFALEPAYGWGRDLTGKYRQIPENDPARRMADDVGFQFIKWRDKEAADILAIMPDADIVCVAQGLMPEIRHNHYPTDLLATQRFYCYDPADIHLQDYFEVDISNVIYQKRMNLEGAIREEIRMMDIRKPNAVFIKGFMSYIYDKIPEIINAMVQLLEPGGTFNFDLQIANWTLARNRWLFNWAQADGVEFKLVEKVDDIEPGIDTIIKKYNLSADIKVTVAPGKDPVGAFVTIRKA